MRIAIIPARAGSKRIPRKNIKLFCGRPMIAWAIDAARACGCFERIIVSTDSDEIACVAAAFGAEVPFRRPAALADDHTGTIPVIGHAIEILHAQQLFPDLVCCIYATAPFLLGADLCSGLEIIEKSGADYALSVTRYGFPVERAIRIARSGRIEMLYPEHFLSRSQDLEEIYHDAGQFYWGRPHAWLAGQSLFSPAAVPVILPPHRVQDIDTPEDWERAEWMFKAMVLQEKASI